MRIISGRFKGHRLSSPRGRYIRPTTDQVREAVFSSLGSTVEGSRVLELFAGTGAFGFEALSRGAQFVVFVDKDRRAINLVKQTVRMLAVQQHVCALNMTWSAAVTHLAGRNEQFQMIFLDPPYGEQWIPQVLCRHDFSDLVALDGVVIVERAVQLQDYRVPVGFERRFHKRYGNTVVEILYRRPGDA